MGHDKLPWNEVTNPCWLPDNTRTQPITGHGDHL